MAFYLGQHENHIGDYVDVLLPNSYAEMNQLRQDLGIKGVPYVVVPNAVDPRLFVAACPDWFEKHFGLRNFVLCAARIEPGKNQLLLIAALRRLGLPGVLVGRACDAEYARLCRELGGDLVTIIDHLPAVHLASAYAAARVHALVSWRETTGLSSLEAALAGCRIVVSDRGPTWEYFGDLAYYCDPGDVDSIARAIEKAWNDHCNAKREELRRKILEKFTWEMAGRKTLEGYRIALSGSKRVRVRGTLVLRLERGQDLPEELREVRRVAIFGAGLTGRQCFEEVTGKGIDVMYFLDNSPACQGGIFMGRPVYPVEYVTEDGYDQIDAVILASAGYKKEMRAQLEGLGFRKLLVDYWY